MTEQATPRWINMIAGLWLVLLAFPGVHSGAQYANALVVGAVTAIAAAIGTCVSWFRYVNVVASLWLFVSTWIFPVLSTGMLWNNVIFAVAIMLNALQPNSERPAYH